MSVHGRTDIERQRTEPATDLEWSIGATLEHEGGGTDLPPKPSPFEGPTSDTLSAIGTRSPVLAQGRSQASVVRHEK
jgi:hypothetical protein